MTLREYQIEAKRTCPSLGSFELDISHMVLGIFSEFVEYVNSMDEVNKSEECSDINWYLANYCTFRGWDLEDIYKNRRYNGNSFVINVSFLQDFVKKNIAYGKKINEEDEYTILCAIAYNLSNMYGKIGIEDSLQKNINKLRVRFPEKFTQENALNRDLESERKELEK